jgi:hypothetical protein
MSAKNSYSVFHLAVLSIVAALFFSSCCWKYNFKSGQVEGKTITIQKFDNEALVVVPTLTQDLTEALRDKFQSQTKLTLVPSGADHVITGAVSDYNVVPLAPTGGDVTASSRLTISVKVKYVNNLKNEQSWDQSFSNFADFSSSTSLADVEKSLNEEIITKITQDIFNKVLSNW